MHKHKLWHTPIAGEWTSQKLSQNRYMSYLPFTMVDGEGVRCSLYVSGCLFYCKKCYNAKAWKFSAGQIYDDKLEDKIMQDLSHPAVQGLSLLGGEPMLNTGILVPLCQRVKSELPNKDIWCWTGYTWEELGSDSQDKRILLSLIDVLVDGRFDISKKDIRLPFRGSSNQRIIDVQKSMNYDMIMSKPCEYYKQGENHDCQ